MASWWTAKYTQVPFPTPIQTCIHTVEAYLDPLGFENHANGLLVDGQIEESSVRCICLVNDKKKAFCSRLMSYHVADVILHAAEITISKLVS